MSLLRFFWRFLLLLLHTLGGIWMSLTLTRRKSDNGESLPDPEPISRWSRRLLQILHVELRCHGQPPHTAALIVANHLSWLDIPVISACTHAAFLSKESIRYWPVIGWFAKASSTVFIRRGKGEAKQVAEAIAERLKGDRQLAIFPEGRVGDGSGVQRFFPRLFSAAIDTHTPVVPVALRYLVESSTRRERVSWGSCFASWRAREAWRRFSSVTPSRPRARTGAPWPGRRAKRFRRRWTEGSPGHG